MTGEQAVAALAASVPTTRSQTLRVVTRGRDSSAIWSTVPGMDGIPAEAGEQIRQQVAALNRQVGWSQFDVWGF